MAGRNEGARGSTADQRSSAKPSGDGYEGERRGEFADSTKTKEQSFRSFAAGGRGLRPVGECEAAEATSSAPANGVSTLLAAASENILSESAMAEQKGSGFRPPNIFANEANGPPKVTLWDEMKTSPILNPAQDGIVTGGISGR